VFLARIFSVFLPFNIHLVGVNVRKLGDICASDEGENDDCCPSGGVKSLSIKITEAPISDTQTSGNFYNRKLTNCECNYLKCGSGVLFVLHR
jgi:hypothetical protein